MSSLASIPEGEVSDTSSRPSSSNSENSEKTNSNAQSSTESQKTRATARSKLMEEAKCVGEALKALQPEFDNIVKQFPKNLCERNQDIFVAWRFLIAGVDNCTRWLPKMRSNMNLRLQNPPGLDLMDFFNARFEEFIMLVRQLQNDLPAPSDFAQPSVWPEAQEGAPILCLRPSDARGLPLTTLHHVFRRFQHEVSGPLAMTAETVVVQIAASLLCSRMGEAFKDEASRGRAFDECVSGVLEKGEADCELKPYPSGHHGNIDWCIREANIPIALREDKLEYGHGGSDAYMKIACCYNLLVGVLTSCSAKDSNASNFLTHGAPCFLIYLIGPMLIVCGGFYDGYKPVVEPLAQPVFMLTDHTQTRQGEVARLLGALARGISSLRRLVTEPCEIVFAPSTPRIYKSCILLDPELKGEEGTLTFVSRANYAYERLFLATLSSPSIASLQVLVKLVPRSYSRDVHRHMADNGLAPKLYGYAEVQGAPTAYVMEYLDPCTWKTLHEFLKYNATAVNRTQLREVVDGIIEKLESKNYVHGDLRSNNIMIRTDVIEKSVDLRVIDFDWAGEAGQVRYPAERNREIWWPGEAGGPIEQDHDLKTVYSWMDALQQNILFTRFAPLESAD